MRDLRVILITGASSGIGDALARAYAAPGRTLVLGGRDAGRLDGVAGTCRDRGATVAVQAIDVTDRAAMAAWVAATDDASPIDLVIANAGISAGASGRGETAEQVRQVFAVNLDGVLNTVLPLVEPMQRRGRGQIALMSSLAAFRGYTGAPAYCGSKAAVRVFGEGLRGALKPAGVGVSVICPGFVRSPMTAVNDFPMPFLMDADRAARIILRGLARNRARIAFPWPTYLGAWLGALLPPSWADPVINRLPRKAALPQDGGSGGVDAGGSARSA